MAKKRALDICIVCISEMAGSTLVLLISGQNFHIAVVQSIAFLKEQH